MLLFSLARRSLAALLAALLIAPTATAAGRPQQPDSPHQQGAQSAPARQDNPDTPDAPSPQLDQQPVPASSSFSDLIAQQNSTATPAGTAAAPSEPPVGVAGSRPAGAAIAPAKQRRVRKILIGVGVLIGAGIAIGTVAALSHASPSTPR